MANTGVFLSIYPCVKLLLVQNLYHAAPIGIESMVATTAISPSLFPNRLVRYLHLDMQGLLHLNWASNYIALFPLKWTLGVKGEL